MKDRQNQRSRFGPTLGAALALHAALLFLVAEVKLAEPWEPPPPEGSSTEFEVLTEPSAPGAAVAPRPTPHIPESARPERPGTAGGARAKVSTTESAPEPNPSVSPDEAPRAPAGGYALDPSAQSAPRPSPKVELGTGEGDWQRFSLPNAESREQANSHDRGAAPRSSAPPVSTTGGLAEALEAHDQAIGLGHDGPVLSAAHDAAHSDVAPVLGTASLVITVLASGAVDVQVTGASSNFADWQKVATRMAATIAKKPPKVRPPRSGVRIGLEVSAAERWPNGAPARGRGLHVSATGSLPSTAEAKESLAHLNPTAVPPPGSPAETPSMAANVDLPGVWIGATGKVCSFRLGITPLGPLLQGGCDPSNIGAKPQRVVSARVTGETMF